MPQNDRHRNRKIPIEFKFYTNLEHMIRKKRLSITLISNGYVKLQLNGLPYMLKAPALVCSNPEDAVTLIKRKDLIAQTFYFDPWYIKACLHFRNLNPDQKVDPAFEHHKMMLYNLFLNRTNTYQGIFNLSPSSYLQLHDHLALIGSETYTQSDRYWTCRIRRLLVASLNQTFNEVVGCTAMKYLNNYRLNIASELLSHTRLTIDDVSQSCGFSSSSYFLKLFKQKTEKTPKKFREFLNALD